MSNDAPFLRMRVPYLRKRAEVASAPTTRVRRGLKSPRA